MFKYSLMLLLLGYTLFAAAQISSPEAISVSYMGEMITHPGIRLAVNYDLKSWDKKKVKKSGSEKMIRKSIDLSPSVGFFYHRRYQTGLFVLPEISFSRSADRKSHFSTGIGLGYMRTFVPNTFEVLETGEVEKTIAGHHYFLANYFLSFGRTVHLPSGTSANIFIKPQFMIAMPNFPNGVGYFALELGIKKHLKN